MTPSYPACAILSPPDDRDWQASDYAPQAAPPRPRKLDMRPHLQPIRNQGGLGSCVPHTIVSGILGFILVVRGLPTRILSTLYPYVGARALDGADPKSEGTYPRSVLDFLKNRGCCLEEDMPYSDTFTPPVGPNASMHAAQNMVPGYARLNEQDIGALMDAVFAHGPCQLTIEVEPGFDNVGHGVAMPGGTGRGLHSVTVVGYDEDERTLLIRNSWGIFWGDAGYCRISFDYVRHEAWVVLAASILKDGTHPSNFPWLVYAANALGWKIPGINA
jgi:C1A family cysteine protease